ncbi:MAG: hypothetical protein ACYDFU_02510 [Nitrospirota bacterium]
MNIAGQPITDIFNGAPANLQDSDFTKNLQLIDGDASAMSVMITPVAGQPGVYSFTFTPVLPGAYSLVISTGTYQWNFIYAVEAPTTTPPVGQSSLIQDVIDRGFSAAMFGFKPGDSQSLQNMVAKVVANKSLELRARYGDAIVLDTTDELQIAAVNKAITELSVAQLWQTRKARIIREVQGTPDAHFRVGLSEEQSAKDALAEYDKACEWIESIVGWPSCFAFGSTGSSHFPRYSFLPMEEPYDPYDPAEDFPYGPGSPPLPGPDPGDL